MPRGTCSETSLSCQQVLLDKRTCLYNAVSERQGGIINKWWSQMDLPAPKLPMPLLLPLQSPPLLSASWVVWSSIREASELSILQAPSGQHLADAYTKSPILIFTIWQTFLYLSFCYPESLIIYLTLCPYHTIPDQHFAQIGTLPTPPYLSPWPAACYHSLHASSRTVYYHSLIVFMLNFNVVQVPYFAWSVMLAEACWVRDSNFNCQIGSVACNTCHHELLCSST